ncbi:P protein [Sclerotinia sclerotiorum rhabdovirus 1]|nr:P protein [Sclerotinia sclerotiorum rhabdovirus 1]
MSNFNSFNPATINKIGFQLGEDESLRNHDSDTNPDKHNRHNSFRGVYGQQAEGYGKNDGALLPITQSDEEDEIPYQDSSEILPKRDKGKGVMMETSQDDSGEQVLDLNDEDKWEQEFLKPDLSQPTDSGFEKILALVQVEESEFGTIKFTNENFQKFLDQIHIITKGELTTTLGPTGLKIKKGTSTTRPEKKTLAAGKKSGSDDVGKVETKKLDQSTESPQMKEKPRIEHHVRDVKVRLGKENGKRTTFIMRSDLAEIDEEVIKKFKSLSIPRSTKALIDTSFKTVTPLEI